MSADETLLVTGGTGFVLSNLVRLWLEQRPQTRALVLDSAPWDARLDAFFAPVRERLRFVEADLRDAAWQEELAQHPVHYLVQGATITPSPERERAEPQLILDVNVNGTITVLEWARSRPELRRALYISSGAVYGEAPPGTPDDPQPEDGAVRPIELYAISKYAGELISHRYGELFGLDIASVRFSGVYGPMDRATPARTNQSIPYHLVHATLARQPITLQALAAGGDWIHAQDVAEALIALLLAPQLRYDVYNVAYGRFVTLDELLAILRLELPDLVYELVTSPDALITQRPEQRLARWNAYDIRRIREDVGWTPRPIAVALLDYLRWVRKEELGIS